MGDEPVPLLDGQYDDFRGRRIPGLSRLRNDIWCLGLPFRPGVPYSLSYVLTDEEGGVHVIDPGADTDAGRERWRNALDSLGAAFTDIRSVVATHLHRDHLGLAAWMTEASGTALHLHPDDLRDLRAGAADSRYSGRPEELAAQWSVPSSELVRLNVPVDLRSTRTTLPTAVVEVEDGALLPIPGVTARVVHTPGHTSGHICLWLPDAGVIVTGDQLLPHMNPPVGKDLRTDRDAVGDFLLSTARLKEFDDADVAPGHGFCFRPLAARRLRVEGHVRRRLAEVAAVLAENPEASVWTIAERITWGPGWENLSGAVLQSALAQTALYARHARAT